MFRQKYSAAGRIFNFLRGVWISREYPNTAKGVHNTTHSGVFLTKLSSRYWKQSWAFDISSTERKLRWKPRNGIEKSLLITIRDANVTWWIINEFENTDSNVRKQSKTLRVILVRILFRLSLVSPTAKADSTRKLTWVPVVSIELQQFLKARPSPALDDRLDYLNASSSLGIHRQGCRATRH